MRYALDHIAIIASDYQRSLAFYQRLGFTVTEEVVRPNDIMTFLTCDGITLELFGKPDAPARVTMPEACGLRHLCFLVDNLDEATRGFDPEPVRLYKGHRFTFIKDPDGLPIEMKER